jgi:heme oxygenase (mycobilin-producing)
MIRVVMEHRTKTIDNAKTLIKLVKDVRYITAKQPGFAKGRTFVDAADPRHIAIITTWESLEDWKKWDESAERAGTRPKIEELLVEPFNAIILTAPIVWREEPSSTKV